MCILRLVEPRQGLLACTSAAEARVTVALQLAQDAQLPTPCPTSFSVHTVISPETASRVAFELERAQGATQAQAMLAMLTAMLGQAAAASFLPG